MFALTTSRDLENQVNEPSARLQGLDLARYIALVGMVIVNFHVVMVPHAIDEAESFDFATLLQGRAAATFVVLAGIGLGLSFARKSRSGSVKTIVRRAAFLLAVGLLNMLVFEADIIHYYAFYFLFGAFFIDKPAWSIWLAVFGLVSGFVCLNFVLDYETGWNWATYTYNDFWTVQGFTRNLFFNGWHPIAPWFAFLLLGLLIARLRLRERGTQIFLLVGGTVIFATTILTSLWLMGIVQAVEPEAAVLFTTSPIPPFPLYVLAGSSAACAVIGSCLLLEPWLARMGVLGFLSAAGRQTLTLYIAHILVGMGTLKSLGLLGGQTAKAAYIAAFLFCLGSTVYAAIWAYHFQHGPLEFLMRSLTSPRYTDPVDDDDEQLPQPAK